MVDRVEKDRNHWSNCCDEKGKEIAELQLTIGCAATA
jgi:hypothetical protein